MSIAFLNKKGKNYVPIITNGDVGSSALGQVYNAALHLITEFPDTIDLAFTAAGWTTGYDSIDNPTEGA